MQLPLSCRHAFKLPTISALVLWIGLCAGCCDKQALPGAFEGLYSSDASDRNKAALVLARCGDRSDKAVPRLGELLYDDNVGVQSSAAYALQTIDTESARELLAEAIARREARRKARDQSEDK